MTGVDVVFLVVGAAGIGLILWAFRTFIDSANRSLDRIAEERERWTNVAWDAEILLVETTARLRDLLDAPGVDPGLRDEVDDLLRRVETFRRKRSLVQGMEQG